MSNYTGVNIAGPLEVTGASTLGATTLGATNSTSVINSTTGLAGILSAGINVVSKTTSGGTVTLSKSFECVEFSNYTAAAATVNVTPVVPGFVLIGTKLVNPANAITFTVGANNTWDGTNKDMVINANSKVALFYFHSATNGFMIANSGAANIAFDNS